MWVYVAAIALGGLAGAYLGSRRTCETGACPLTSNPWTGALYGAVLAFLAVSTVSASSDVTRNSQGKEKEMSVATGKLIIEVETPQDFRAKVLDASVPVLVDLWAPWCGPCRAQAPILERVADAAGDRARVVKVDVDSAGEIAQTLGVQSIPTLIVFRGGREERRFVGVQSEAALLGALGL